MVLFDNYNDVIQTLSRTGYKIVKDENIPNTDKNIPNTDKIFPILIRIKVHVLAIVWLLLQGCSWLSWYRIGVL